TLPHVAGSGGASSGTTGSNAGAGGGSGTVVGAGGGNIATGAGNGGSGGGVVGAGSGSGGAGGGPARNGGGRGGGGERRGRGAAICGLAIGDGRTVLGGRAASKQGTKSKTAENGASCGKIRGSASGGRWFRGLFNWTGGGRVSARGGKENEFPVLKSPAESRGC